MQKLSKANLETLSSEHFPVKVLQFGTGSFLRGFIDWMVDEMNRKGLFSGKISVIQSTSGRTIEQLCSQDNLYTLMLRGLETGEAMVKRSIVSSIARGVCAGEDFDAVLTEAENLSLRIIVSNTTESGIVLSREDKVSDHPPKSFPGKLLRLLRHRYEYFQGDKSKGFLIFPCELIEKNGDVLREILLELSHDWYPDDHDFKNWFVEANTFFNTLVDRIVSGYPKGEDEEIFRELGYEDSLLNAGELFHFFAIEGSSEFQKEFPLIEAGFNVKWCDDITPYRIRKVRILNGAHTMSVLAAHLKGLTTVKECMGDALVVAFLRRGLFDEILPTMDLPEEELKEFAEAVIERFSNPYLEHLLLSISLNSVSKWRTRILPTYLDSLNAEGRPPKILTFSLVALVLFYRGKNLVEGGLEGVRASDGASYMIQDSAEVLGWFLELWQNLENESRESSEGVMKKVLGNVNFWGRDLSETPGLVELSGEMLSSSMKQGIASVMATLVDA